MILYRVNGGAVLWDNACYYSLGRDWNELVNDDVLLEYLHEQSRVLTANDELAAEVESPLPPIGDQEIWAAGVTYYRSRTARMEESEGAGGGDFYDRVYGAERPELFFKASRSRTVGPGEAMHLRRDSRWIVPEPELTLVITRSGKIIGYTVGNDLSCRDIEGENPLYLPQAKTFARCAAIGPGILVSKTQPPPETAIRLRILRDGKTIADDSTTLDQLKRSLEELVEFLFRENEHPNGCLLMTGTGIIPADDFSLQAGDEVQITIDGIGTLVNRME